MARNLSDKLSDFDKKIRQGKGSEVRAALERIPRTQISKRLQSKFAELCWRCGGAEIGARLLSSQLKSPSDMKPGDVAEYAMCLIKMGLNAEAMGLLDGIDEQKVPRVMKYKAFGHAHCWEYAQSIKLLKRYVSSSRLSLYERMVVNVNLASALLFCGRHSEATRVLREVLYQTSIRKFELLHANALELSAENFVLQEKWANVSTCLEKARNHFSDTSSVYHFLLKKWEGLMVFLQSPETAEGQEALESVRQAARERKHWEVLRDCDRFESLAKGSLPLLHRIHFGTPHQSFKDRVLEEFPKTVKLPDYYVWSESDAQPLRIYDPESLDSRTGLDLKPGKSLHRLFLILTSDFYRPFRVGEVFSRLFPGEHFNTEASPSRVHQAVKLLREHLLPHQIRIDEDGGWYQLRLPKGVGIRLTRQRTPADAGTFLLEKLKRQWPQEPFSTKEAADYLDVPDWTARRLLSKAFQEKTIDRSGSRRGAKYHFLSEDSEVSSKNNTQKG